MKKLLYTLSCCLVFLGLGLMDVNAQGVCDDASVIVNAGWGNPAPNGDGFAPRSGTQLGRIFIKLYKQQDVPG